MTTWKEVINVTVNLKTVVKGRKPVANPRKHPVAKLPKNLDPNQDLNRSPNPSLSPRNNPPVARNLTANLLNKLAVKGRKEANQRSILVAAKSHLINPRSKWVVRRREAANPRNLVANLPKSPRNLAANPPKKNNKIQSNCTYSY
jgi:hypothetical protein